MNSINAQLVATLVKFTGSLKTGYQETYCQEEEIVMITLPDGRVGILRGVNLPTYLKYQEETAYRYK